ncbi:Mss4-like protein [Auriculariales sp. MPI-PUGE-AT-0066]|nr:Mss4-like protein [Auriculariales sp. MPI-PUGE-AT-0066]
MAALTLEGGCHCGSIRYTIDPKVTDGDERWKGNYCYCDDCRLTLGFFFGLFISPDTNRVRFEDKNGTLVHYQSSAKAKRTHCGTCGASITWQHDEYLEGIDIHAGTIELPAALKGSGKGLLSLFDPVKHLWLQDQHLGGLGVLFRDDGLLKRLNITNGPSWEPKPETLQCPAEESILDDETLDGGCHCGGIRFTISRPPADYAKDPVLAKWIKKGRKMAAMHCWCDMCRLVSGAAFWTWAFVPTKLLTFTSNSTERIYKSSPDRPINRRFCSTCGCSYSFAFQPDGGDDMWDMAAATFDFKDSKPERWLAFGPTPRGGDPADEPLGKWINGWASPDASGRGFCFGESGDAYNPEMIDIIRKGRMGCARF